MRETGRLLFGLFVVCCVAMDCEPDCGIPVVNLVDSDDDLNVSALDRTIQPEDFGSDFW